MEGVEERGPQPGEFDEVLVEKVALHCQTKQMLAAAALATSTRARNAVKGHGLSEDDAPCPQSTASLEWGTRDPSRVS